MQRPRKPQRQIPIVSAILALVFCAAVIFGTVSIIVDRVTTTGDDIGLHIDGAWETQTLTYNDEHIIYVFAGDSFSRTTESTIFNANPDDIEAIREFHMEYNGAIVEAVDIADGNFRLSITANGTFVIDDNNILLVAGEGLVSVLPFYWESEAIVINGDRYVRR
ncbi:MAG: hypothetical protein FWC77_03180 [Defluviitaleaceae bacterium]|nr:hypothetical protein [Defluviitaleaceae bacterium]